METQIHFSGNDIYWKSRKLGTIYSSGSTFQSVNRTPKNVFKMFDGLGLNRQLLNHLYSIGIKIIRVPFCSKILETTTEKWISKGIPLPLQYCSGKVDEQLILPLDKINLDESEPLKMSIADNQLSMFGVTQ